MKITDIVEGDIATKSDLQGLEEALIQKILNTADGSGGDLVPELSDPEILNFVITDAPFLLRMQSLGNIQPHRSKIVSTRVKTSGATTHAIAETDNIPTGTDAVYDKIVGNMTTHVTPVKISLMEQLASQDVTDVREDELRDAILGHFKTLNQEVIAGTGGSNTLTGLSASITTNTENMAGEQITSKFEVDDLCRRVMASGGSPTALLTTANIQSQLEEVLYPNIQVVPSIDMAFGYQATSYLAPNGRRIPIIVDADVPDDTDQQELYVLTEPQIRLKQLLPPTRFDVPAAYLGTSDVIASFDYLQIRGEKFNGKMYNIGTKTE